jgi:hypothetical protein
MIIFDENIHQESLMEAVARWYPGKVLSVTELRPGTFIPDEEVPTLLHRAKGATFITTNVTDFWRRLPAHPRYCIVCFPLPNERIEEIPDLLRELLHLPEFRTKAARMGKVIRASSEEIRYYQVGDPQTYSLAWPD